MLQWLLDSASAPGSLLPPLVATAIVGSVVLLVATREPAPTFGTRQPKRLKSRLPVLEDLITLLRAPNHMQEWVMSALEEVDFAPFLVRAPGIPDITYLCSPEAFEEVFKTQFDAFPKGEFQRDRIHDLFGDGILGTDGELWSAQRKMASRLFTMRALRESMTSTIRKDSVLLCEIFERAAQSGERLDLFNLFNRFTIEAFAEMGFGLSLGCLDNDQDHPFRHAFDRAMRQIAKRFMRPTWFWKTQRWLGVGSEAVLRHDMEVINSTVLGIINHSMAARQQQVLDANGGEVKHPTSGNSDIVSLFLDNYASLTGESSASFDSALLRDVVINFLLAGHDTTTQSLSWFFYRITGTPRVAEKVRAELREKIPELFQDGSKPPTMEQVGKLVYLDAALRESVRLHPTVPTSTKTPNRDVVLSDGTPLQANKPVFLAFYGMARNPHVWGPDAAEYKPERWLEYPDGSGEPKIKSISSFKFISFNAGPRTCLGMNLAMLEMKIVVASLLSRFRVELTDPENVTYEFSMTLPVKGAMWAAVERLPTAASA